MTVAAIALPKWISFTSPVPSVPGRHSSPIQISYGLHTRCSSLTGTCSPFPQAEDCRGEDRYFCSMWRSVGFLMSLTVVFELACLVGFAVVLLGGRQKHENGWRMIAGLLGVVAITQCISMVLVAYLNDHDTRFSIGWSLDASTILCTVSWVLVTLNIGGVVGAAFVLPPEDEYEPIADRD